MTSPGKEDWSAPGLSDKGGTWSELSVKMFAERLDDRW